MANLIITSRCNMNCSFCFAGRARGKAESHMELPEFQHLVQQLSPGAEIRFCGGEPTLNPQFFEMLVWAVNETVNPIIIMTNGIWPDRVYKQMEQLGADVWKRISVLFNIHRESFYSPEDHTWLMAVLGMVYPLNAILGTTIHSTEFTGENIIRLAKRFNIPTLRYSIAAPILENAGNAAIGPNDYRKLAGPVHSFLMNADREGLTVNSDCGYIPFCMFTEAQQRDLLILGRKGFNIKFHCDSATDIGRDGEVWRCYGLYSALNTNTGLFNRIDEIPLYFDTQVRQLKHTHLYEKCLTCEHQNSGLCGGGCFVFRVAGMKKQPFPLNDDDWLMDAVPVREPSVSLWKNSQGEAVSAIPVNTPGGRALIHFQDGDNPVSFYEILGACDGSYRVKDLVERWVDRFETADSARQFILFAMRLFFEQKAVDLKSD